MSENAGHIAERCVTLRPALDGKLIHCRLGGLLQPAK